MMITIKAISFGCFKAEMDYISKSITNPTKKVLENHEPYMCSRVAEEDVAPPSAAYNKKDNQHFKPRCKCSALQKHLLPFNY